LLSEDTLAEGLATEVNETWQHFLDTVEPLRTDLFRFALSLAGNPFDAEDLVHDGMLRAFGTFGLNREEIHRRG
jgi:DNA-directed RNA polymerase specialized sigma24 family protein